MNPLFQTDSYKQFHHRMYPSGITKLYSNMTPRSYKRLGCKHSVFFGLQYYIKEYLQTRWNEDFFNRDWSEIEQEYKRFHKSFSGVEDVDCEHIKKLHTLGYLPLRIKALPEGALVPEKVPYLTITNTHPDFAWLVNFLETQMSTVLWDLTTVATISREYRILLNKWADKTCTDRSHVQWQGHDFSMRGRSSMETAYASQAGHLLNFTGTDTIPAVFFLEKYYNANIEKELVGASVPATEHSVMTSYGKEDEFGAFTRLLQQFPTGILSIVSDSFDLWKVCTDFLPRLKDQILARDGKIVIRPDSGNPVDIVCGYENYTQKDGQFFKFEIEGKRATAHAVTEPECRGVIELLWDVFGGTINEKGYKVLNPHIGCIYGDSITLDRADEICRRLEKKGFASSNIVFGIGSYTFNCNTRDTLGIAFKATYCEVDGEAREIYKDPITDDGTKKSARGLLKVERRGTEYYLQDRVSPLQEIEGSLRAVFEDGQIIQEYTLSQIRQRLDGRNDGSNDIQL